jgi:hypothetical protein
VPTLLGSTGIAPHGPPCAPRSQPPQVPGAGRATCVIIACTQEHVGMVSARPDAATRTLGVPMALAVPLMRAENYRARTMPAYTGQPKSSWRMAANLVPHLGTLAPWHLGTLALALSPAPHAPGASRHSSVPRQPRPPPARCHIEPAIAGTLPHRAGPISGRPPAHAAKAAGPTESDPAPGGMSSPGKNSDLAGVTASARRDLRPGLPGPLALRTGRACGNHGRREWQERRFPWWLGADCVV